MSMLTTEAALIKRAQNQDADALLELYERYYMSILNYVGYRVFDRECAEDLTADVFVRMVEKIDTFIPGKRPFLAWLYTIARNLIVDNLRRQAKVTILPIEEEVFSIYTESYENELIFVRESLRNALEKLTEEQRQVIVLKFVESRKNGEVAELMGKNERAIRSLQYRALAALQRVMEKDGWHES